MYSGFVPALSGSVLFRAIPFVGISGTDRFLRERDVLTDQPIGGWLVLLCCTTLSLTGCLCVDLSHSPVKAFACGAVGGFLRSLVECPVEVMKTRAQVRAAGTVIRR